MKSRPQLLYLLGHSRSGSTVLSMHLGLHPEIFYAGELKKFNISYHGRTCTCGLAAMECPFWGEVIRSSDGYFEKKVDKDIGILLFFRSMFALLRKPSMRKLTQETTFLKRLVGKVEGELPRKKYILDSSKSLSRLIMYRNMKDVDIHVIYMERDMRANIASFVKRGEGLLSSYFRLKVNRFLMTYFLRLKQIRFVSVNLEEFINDPQASKDRVLKHCNIDLRPNMKESISDIHLISGNRKTRFNSLDSKYKIDPSVNEEDPFTSRQKKVLKLLGL